LAAIAATAICTLAIALIAILAPGARTFLLREDGIVETASVVCLVIALVAALTGLLTQGLRLPFLLAGLIAFVELLDETSFGARAFGFKPPALYGGGELDGFHDLMILAYRLLRDVSPGLGWIWAGLIFLASAGVGLLALRLAVNEIRGEHSRLADHAVLFLHVALVGAAQGLDVSGASSALEEALELSAAVVLVFYVLQHLSQPELLPESG
jgi:hypothetical protein